MVYDENVFDLFLIVVVKNVDFWNSEVDDVLEGVDWLSMREFRGVFVNCRVDSKFGLVWCF